MLEGSARGSLPRWQRWGAWLLLVLIPLTVGLSATLVLARLHAHERDARTGRLYVAHVHEDVLLQNTLATHAVVMGYLTDDLSQHFEALRSDTLAELSRLDHLGGRPDAARIRDAFAAFSRSRHDALATLPMAKDVPTGMGAMTGMSSAPAVGLVKRNMGDATAAVRLDDAPYGRVLNAVAAADQDFASRAGVASRDSYVGSVSTVSIEALILTLLFGGLSRLRQRAVVQTHRAVSESEARFRSLVQNSSDVVAVLSADLRIDYVTPSVAPILGHEPTALQGESYLDLVHPADRSVLAAFLGEATGRPMGTRSVEYRLGRADGTFARVESLASKADEGPLDGLVLTTRDITQRKALEEQLAHQAFHDSLTGLPNRALFADRLAHALVRRNDQADALAVLFLDLDDFKTINDSLGHGCGDEVLAEVAARLQSLMRAADTAARFGGDEFAVLLENVVDVRDAQDVARRLSAEIARPVRVGDTDVVPAASIGIAIGLAGVSTADELLRDADVAMYAAKGLGKGGLRVYEPDMHDAVRRRLQLKADLERALQAGEFTVHYQPTVALDTRLVTGFEALVRWEHPTRGLVAPNDFIPLAEETGLIVPLGHWVLREACAQAAEWQRAFPQTPTRTMSVNISAVQLQHPDLVEQVAAALADAELPASSLVLEITESVLLVDKVASADRLVALKGLGVKLAIDDFGTGYSSLSQLRNLPVDILKIDKCFVDNVATVVSDAALTTAIIEMGEALDLELVAEGIEHEDQADALQRLRCDLGQGFMFARPLTAAAAHAVLAGDGELRAVL